MVPFWVSPLPVVGTHARPVAVMLLGLAALVGHAEARQMPRLRYPPLTALPAVTQQGRPQLAYPALPPEQHLATATIPLDPVANADAPAFTAPEPEPVPMPAYQPRPAIWRIADRDTRLYLIGTIHVLPPGFAWRTALLDSIVARSRLLIVESVETGGNGGIKRLLARHAAEPALPALATRVSPDHRERLAEFAATLPPEAAALLDRMPTWVASIAVDFVRELRLGDVPGPGADDWLEAVFKAAGKPVIPIENGEQVMANMNGVAASEQRAMLDAALDARDRSPAERRAPLIAWAKGDIRPESALAIDVAGANGAAALSAPLVTMRNRAWATALARRLQTPGTALFAAGAAHFIGKGSVIEQLESLGIRVRRVQ